MVTAGVAILYLFGPILLLGYGQASPCPGFSKFHLFKDNCYQLDNSIVYLAIAKKSCAGFLNTGAFIARPKDEGEIQFLNTWLVQENIKSVWLGNQTVSGKPLIMEPSLSAPNVLKHAQLNHKHQFVCQADAVDFNVQKYIFPTFVNMSGSAKPYLEVTNSARNQISNFRLRCYKDTVERTVKDYTQRNDIPMIINIGNTTEGEGVCALETDTTDSSLTAILYWVDGQTVTDSLLLPVLPESMVSTLDIWTVFFVSRFEADYTFFLVGVRPGMERVRFLFVLNGLYPQARYVDLEEFELVEINQYLTHGDHVNFQSYRYFSVFFLTDQSCCGAVPKMEQIWPLVLASDLNVLLPTPTNDSQWECGLDVYGGVLMTNTWVINVKESLVGFATDPLKYHRRPFQPIDYFISVHFPGPLPMKQYFRKEHLTEKRWTCEMNLLPLEMWNTRYTFNLQFIDTQTDYGIEEVFLYIVYRWSPIDVQILLNDEDITEVFECSNSTGYTFIGCIGSLGFLRFLDQPNVTSHLSTTLPILRFGAFLLIQTAYQSMCRPLGFLNDFDTWSAQRGIQKLPTSLNVPLVTNTYPTASPTSSPEGSSYDSVSDENTNQVERSTKRTYEHLTVSELEEFNENTVAVGNQNLDISTETHQSVTSDDVDTETGVNRKCRCFRMPHPCLNVATTVPTITSEEAKQELVNEIKKELTVDAEQTSSAIRKRTSANDKRTSSVSLGLLGVAMISIVLSLVILPDAVTLISFFISCL